jgi:type IV secretory pathway VirD2 relaxase
VIRALVKHSYIKGRKGVAKARAHINYLQYRPGEDREKNARPFFDRDRDDVLGRDIKERLLEQEQRGVTIHKLILSPGINGVDLETYTRETMEHIERQKGLNLEWYAVRHENTDHHHVHVVVMGKERDGHDVRFDRQDHKRLRESGDRYLEREHTLDRYLDRELELLLKRPERERETEYKRQRGDAEYERLLYGDQRDRRRTRDAERDRREWEQLDRDLHKAFEPNRGLEHRMTYRQFQREAAGRLQDFHHDFQSRAARDRWQEVSTKQPELAGQIQRELAWLEDLEREQKMDRFGRGDVDRLIDGKDEHQRWFDRVLEREQRDSQREGGDERKHTGMDDDHVRGIDVMDMFTGKYFEHKRDWPEIEMEDRSSASQSFENDRETRQQRRHDDREERERDRSDDLFSR